MTGSEARTILVVEDEAAIRDMLSYTLHRGGYSVIEAADTREAMEQLEQKPDLVLLDWMLPGLSGVDLARRLRREDVTAKLPIILLTARGEENDRVHGLEVGADDYITKPFSPRELIARINAVLRRSRGGSEERSLEFGGLELDPVGHRVQADGRRLDLAPTEFRLLHFFMSNPDRVYSREQLLDHVWGYDYYGDASTVTVHVRRLREKIEQDPSQPRWVQTVWGVGYRFEP